MNKKENRKRKRKRKKREREGKGKEKEKEREETCVVVSLPARIKLIIVSEGRGQREGKRGGRKRKKPLSSLSSYSPMKRNKSMVIIK